MDNSETTMIIFRIKKLQKQKWKTICDTKNISLTSLIIGSVENRILENERKELLKFIENQDNIFLKIENNINQFAKYANTKKFIDSKELGLFNQRLSVIANLKSEQNKMFEKIYSLIANG